MFLNFRISHYQNGKKNKKKTEKFERNFVKFEKKLSFLKGFWVFILFFSLSYDICIVFSSIFEEDEEKLFSSIGDIIKKLHNAGLNTLLYFDVAKINVYCLVGASERRLHYEAERCHYDFRMNGEQVLAYARSKEMKIAKACLNDPPNEDENIKCNKKIFLSTF